jgi:hypothetical protein
MDLWDTILKIDENWPSGFRTDMILLA